MKKIIFTIIGFLALGSVAYAATTVPLGKNGTSEYLQYPNDSLSAAYYIATSTTATSTFSQPVIARNLILQGNYPSGNAYIQLMSDFLGNNIRNVIQSGNASGYAAEGSITFAIGSNANFDINAGDNNTFNLFSDANFNFYDDNGSTVAMVLSNDRTQPALGINTLSPTATIDIVGKGSINPFAIASSSGASLFNVLRNGNVGIGTTSPYAKLSVAGTIVGANFVGTTTATSTFGGGINLATGCFAINNACVGSSVGIINSGTTGQFPYYAANGTTLTATSSLFLATSGNVGIGTTTPQSPFNIATNNVSFNVGSSGCISGFAYINFSQSPTCSNYSFLGGDGNTYLNSAGTIFQRIGNSASAQTTLTSAAGFTVFTLDSSSGGVVRNSTGDFYLDNSNASGAIRLRPGAFNESLTLLSNGNVGVGATSPSTRLDVNGALSFTGAGGTGNITKDGNNSTGFDFNFGGGAGTFRMTTAAIFGTNDQFFQFVPGATSFGVLESALGAGLAVGTDNSADPIIFTPGRVEKVRIAGDGSVGIGTTSPITKLDVNGKILLEPTSSTTAPTALFSTYFGQLYNDNLQNQLSYNNGNDYKLGGNLYTATADKTINSTSPTSAFASSMIGTTTIQANTLKAGQRFTIWGSGYYSTPIGNTSTVTITPQIASSTGTVNISTVTTGIFPASATNLPYDFRLNCTVRSIGSAGTLVCDGTFNYATALTGVSPTSNSLSTVSTITFNSTVKETLDVKVSWSAVTTQTATVQESWIDF